MSIFDLKINFEINLQQLNNHIENITIKKFQNQIAAVLFSKNKLYMLSGILELSLSTELDKKNIAFKNLNSNLKYWKPSVNNFQILLMLLSKRETISKVWIIEIIDIGISLLILLFVNMLAIDETYIDVKMYYIYYYFFYFYYTFHKQQ